MKKLLELSEIIKKLGLKEESLLIYKMAMALPAGVSIDRESIGDGIGVPGGITPQFLKKNISLKEIFKNHYDPNFFKNFNYIHYFRSSDSSASEYIKSYGPSSGGNPVEISVVGAPISVCELKNKTQASLMGRGSLAFSLEGEPTSAFYYDATSSYFEQMHSPHWLSTLEEFGINPEEYNPKLINITDSRLNSFFFDQKSYDEVASMGHPSDYHEIFLRNSKVKEVLLDETLDKEEVREFLKEIDPYWLGEGASKKIDVAFCVGASKLTGSEARHKIVEWMDSYFIERNGRKILDSEKFYNMFGATDVYSSESKISSSERLNKGLDILEDGLYNKAELKEVFSSLNLILPYNESRNNYLDRFMSTYLDQYKNIDSIYNLDDLWYKVFSNNDYQSNQVDTTYMPTSFKTYSVISGQKEVSNLNPIEEISSPIFKRIKQNILNKISAPATARSGIENYVKLLLFLADTGMFCYENNIKNKAFDYYLTMVKETEELTKDILNNETTKLLLIDIYDSSLINQIYNLEKYSTSIVKTILDIYRSYSDY